MSEAPYEYVYHPNPHGIGEDLEDYEERGLHPVDLHQKYNSTTHTYQIVHKLGHGGSSTVWVAHDLRASQSKLYAFKIISARMSATSQEVAHTRQMSQHRSLGPYLPRLVETFSVTGPNCVQNENHTVIIFELLGPSIGRLSYGCTRLRPSIARKVMYRTTHALSILHAAGVVHRDLTANNVVLRLDPRITRGSPAAFIDTYGQPNTLKIGKINGRDPRPRAPLHSVDAVDLARAPHFVLPEPVLIDFGESAPATDTQPTRRVGIPSSWAAPEVMFDNCVYPTSDVWSLGCIIYQARAGCEIFTLDCAADVYLEMVMTLGGPPPPLNRWNDADFTNEGSLILLTNPKRGGPWYKTRKPKRPALDQILKPDQYKPLKEKVFNIRDRPPGMACNSLFWGSGDRLMDENELKYPRIAPEEARLLYDLLSKIFVWDHTKRITAAEVLQHSWFSYGSKKMYEAHAIYDLRND